MCLSPSLTRALARASLVRGGFCAFNSKVISQQQKPKAKTPVKISLLIKQSIATFSSGAVLGPFCDAQHSRYHVLKYADPQTLEIPGLGYSMQTCWWVPLLFGAAGIIIGTGQPLMDAQFAKGAHEERPQPSWGKVVMCISVFVVQYWLSGYLGNEMPNYQLLVFLGFIALAQWGIFDATLPGFLLAALTSLCGPIIEVALINVGHLYSYSKPDFLGIPAWIGAVYFCGGPAVGNLGRRVWYTLEERHKTP